MATQPDITSRVDAIREAQYRWHGVGFTICQGDDKCTTEKDAPKCIWCYWVPPGDTRTADQIEKDILLQQRGH